ncbi:MAG: hypothetical protein R2824_15790 [Saprospiraceae bacterium]|nr:hypothetical protein [Lewinella sp.]
MHRLYGTYLLYLVEETLRKTETPLSIKEISERIVRLDSPREQYNLQERVRRALGVLEAHQPIIKQMHRISTNVYSFKYQIHQHEQLY